MSKLPPSESQTTLLWTRVNLHKHGHTCSSTQFL